jgi:flagellar motor protein MotB
MIAVRRRAKPTLFGMNPFLVLADLSINLVLVLLFYALAWTLNSSKAYELMQLQARQGTVTTALQGSFEQELKSGQMRITLDGNLQRIHFSDNILFDSGIADLKDHGKQMLYRLCTTLQQERSKFTMIHVEGHTDNIPITNARFHSNWELSSARATAVVQFFQHIGIAPDMLVASGYGEYRPVASNATEVGRSLNRRIDIVLVYSQVEPSPLDHLSLQ